jgi:hypothetical protein
MATRKQIAANRRNAGKGGPKTARGKAAVAQNARTHGIFACELTSEDAAELAGVQARLAGGIRPVGPVEAVLVEKLAHTYLRLQRCARAEAEYHVATWGRKTDRPAITRYADALTFRVHASWFDRETFQMSVQLFARYDQTLTNPFPRLLHEIERLQRLRMGEAVPPPLAADLSLVGDVEVAEIEDEALVLLSD